jgi:hypothetical protein
LIIAHTRASHFHNTQLGASTLFPQRLRGSDRRNPFRLTFPVENWLRSFLQLVIEIREVV